VTDTDTAPIQETPGASPARKRRRLQQRILWLLGPLLVLAGVGWYVFTSGRYASTDNAYLRADVITVASEVAGRVLEVYVHENQHVRAGDILFRIDSRPYELAIDELRAQATAAGQYLDSSREGYNAALADLDARRSDLEHARKILNRIEDLRTKGVASQESLDDAVNGVETARADQDAAAAEVAKALAMLSGDARTPLDELAVYRIIQARLARAELDLDHTVIRAPSDGTVGKQSLQPGDYLNIGQAAMPLVTENIWVDANFKETDMTWVYVGQKASFTLDTYPRRKWQAEVASISPASSAMFSVLPAENATGNWVKVVQRIPVRLRIVTPQSAEAELRAGMSAVVKIDTGSGHTPLERWFGALMRDAGKPGFAGVTEN